MSYVLHLGDCLDPATGLASLADGSVDHLICDPPYSEHVHSRSRRGSTGYAEVQSSRGATFNRVRDLGFKSLDAETLEGVAEQAARIAKRWVLAFCDVESSHLWRDGFVSRGLDYVRTGAWIKVGCTPQFTGDRPATGFEAIVIAHPKGRKRWNGGGSHAVWSEPIVLDRGGQCEKREHTAQKPVALMEKLVRLFTDPGDTILDPFAGSGTTGVAALRMGRNFIGWERDPKYHAIATKRLANAREQMELVA